MANTSNNPSFAKLNELRSTSPMVSLETRIKEHYKAATKSVRLLRVDLLSAHKMLSTAGCAGQFSAWLKMVDIPKSTAYYILGTKKNGKFADEGTGKWGAAPKKPPTAKQKKANRSKAAKNFRNHVIDFLQAKGPQGAREYMSKMFAAAFPEVPWIQQTKVSVPKKPPASVTQVRPEQAQIQLGRQA
jgi:hypothetical protein